MIVTSIAQLLGGEEHAGIFEEEVRADGRHTLGVLDCTVLRDGSHAFDVSASQRQYVYECHVTDQIEVAVPDTVQCARMVFGGLFREMDTPGTLMLTMRGCLIGAYMVANESAGTEREFVCYGGHVYNRRSFPQLFPDDVAEFHAAVRGRLEGNDAYSADQRRRMGDFLANVRSKTRR